MSFGTYTTQGGWNTIVLREEGSGKHWVVHGYLPQDDSKLGLKVVEI